MGQEHIHIRLVDQVGGCMRVDHMLPVDRMVEDS